MDERQRTHGVPETTPIAGHDAGEGWHLRPPRRLLAVVLAFLAVAIFMVPGALIVTERPVAGIFCLVVGLLLAQLPFISRNSRAGEPTVVTYEGRRAMLLPVNPMSWRGIVTAGLFGLILLVAGVWSAVARFTGDDSAPGVVGALFVLVLGGLCLAAGLAGLRQRRREDLGLLLDHEGITLNTRLEPVRLPWGEVTAVRPHWTRHRRRLRDVTEQISNWLTFERAPDTDGAAEPDQMSLLSGSPHPTVPVERFAIPEHVVLAACTHYWRHPEHRHELGTEEALRRVQAFATRRGT